MSEFEGLRCGKQTTLVFVQSGKGVTHCLLHRPGILGDHRGLLPKAENPFPDRPDYHPNRAPKRPNATVNKFRILSPGTHHSEEEPESNGTRLSLTHWALRCYGRKHRHVGQ